MWRGGLWVWRGVFEGWFRYGGEGEDSRQGRG